MPAPGMVGECKVHHPMPCAAHPCFSAGLLAATLNPSLVQPDPLPQPVNFLFPLTVLLYCSSLSQRNQLSVRYRLFTPRVGYPNKMGELRAGWDTVPVSAGHFISQEISILWSPPRSWSHSKYMASPLILWPHSEGWRKKSVVKASMSPHSKPHSKCFEPRHCGLWGSLSPVTSSL